MKLRKPSKIDMFAYSIEGRHIGAFMSDDIEKFLREFDSAIGKIETTRFRVHEKGVEELVSVLSRRFNTHVSHEQGHVNLALLRADLSDLRLGAAQRTLICVTTVDDPHSPETVDLLHAIVAAHYGFGLSGGFTIALPVGEGAASLARHLSSLPQDILVLTKDELREIIEAADWSQRLADFVVARGDRYDLNPYSEFGVCRPSMFFGRRREFALLSSSRPESPFGIVGCRRIGKSSLMLHLLRHFRRKREPTYLVDLRYVSDTVLAKERIVWETDKANFASRKSQNIRDYLLRLTRGSGLPVNLFLDEVDAVVADDSHFGFEFLQRLVSAHATLSGNLRLWLVGYKTLYAELLADNGPFGGSIRPCILRGLDPRATVELATDPVAKSGHHYEDSSAATEAIVRITDGHPAFVQCCCRLLLDQCAESGDQTISMRQIDQIEEHEDFVDFVMRYFKYNTTALERVIILNIVQDEAIQIETIQKKLRDGWGFAISLNQIDKELGDLRAAGVLQRKGNQYSFVFPVLPRTISSYAPPDLQIQEYIKDAALTIRGIDGKAQ